MASIPADRPKVLTLVAFTGRENLVRSEARTIRSADGSYTTGVGTVPSLILIMRLGRDPSSRSLSEPHPSKQTKKLTTKKHNLAILVCAREQRGECQSTCFGIPRTALLAEARTPDPALRAGPARSRRRSACPTTTRLWTSPLVATSQCPSRSLDGQALDRDDVGPGDQPTEQVRREPAHGGLVLTGRVGGKLRWILPQRGGLQRDLRNRLWLRLRLWLSRVEPNTRHCNDYLPFVPNIVCLPLAGNCSSRILAHSAHAQKATPHL